jgi:hypothetical protein
VRSISLYRLWQQLFAIRLNPLRRVCFECLNGQPPRPKARIMPLDFAFNGPHTALQLAFALPL